MLRRVVLVGGLIVLAAWGGWALWHSLHPGETSQPTDPRETFATPFRNVRPGVQYVGDAACASCHPRHAKTYRQHPMGQSLTLVSDANDGVRYERGARNPFKAAGFTFQVERRDGQVFHRESRPGPHGEPIEYTAEVRYAIGSGRHARSYLIERDGFLVESALTWYAQKGVWDLSPGFAANPHSDRAITAECLFCHCNRVEPIAGTVNRYRQPVFEGLTIGCERCHGPGELHVRQAQAGTLPANDDTIVNPARLPPALREAVCQQCHLQGVARVLRQGRQPFDFRPGLPLDLFWSVFVAGSGSSKAVSQVEQMMSSQCFRQSNGRLGCSSCHDPHELPPPNQRAAYFRDRCLACHKTSDCGLAPAARRQQQDSCIACHMKRLPTADVAHTALTDHRLLRPGRSAEPARPAAAALLLFPGVPVPSEDTAVGRDLGVALVRLADTGKRTAAERARQALPLLERAVQAAPEDVAGWQALGSAHWLLGQKQEARAAFERALGQAPKREETLTSLAVVSRELGRYDVAIDTWQRALAVNPYAARYHYELARLLVLRGDWAGALAQAQAAIRLHPFHREAREILILSHLQRGDRTAARAEWERLLSLNPPDVDRLRRWLGPQLTAPGR